MKKLTVLSIAAAALLLVGCNESSTGAEAKAAGEAKVEASAEKAKMKCGEGKCGGEMKKAAEAKAAEAAADTKEAVAETAGDAKNSVAEKATEAKDAVVEKAGEVKDAVAEKAAAATAAVAATATAAVEKTKEAASAVAEKAGEVKDAAVEKVEGAKEAVAKATGGDDKGKALFAKCASCHGADGKTAALGKSAIIAGQAAADLETKISGYKAGTLNTAGMGALMKGQVASYSDEDIKALAAYISGL